MNELLFAKILFVVLALTGTIYIIRHMVAQGILVKPKKTLKKSKKSNTKVTNEALEIFNSFFSPKYITMIVTFVVGLTVVSNVYNQYATNAAEYHNKVLGNITNMFPMVLTVSILGIVGMIIVNMFKKALK